MKTRIPGALGISKPPAGMTIPTKKGKSSGDRGLDWGRGDAGAAGLSIMGDRDTLDPVL